MRPNPTSPPPLKPSDYISPTGVRMPWAGRRDARLGPRCARERRRRTAPTMARGASPCPGPVARCRRSPALRAARRCRGGPRPALDPAGRVGLQLAAARIEWAGLGRAVLARARAGPGGDAKTQRPERRFTPEEMRRMMQAGQIGGAEAPPVPGRGPVGRPGGPGAVAPVRRPARPRSADAWSRGPGGPRWRASPGVGPGAVAPPPLAPPVIDDEEEKKKAAGRLGTPADRAGRRAKRNERANERRISSPQPASSLTAETEDDSRGRRGGRKRPRSAAASSPRSARATPTSNRRSRSGRCPKRSGSGPTT